ncbi:hypothetical protein PLICRDRAFT_177306 [Plicaturopsis crispa FD-325 SS-3]|nr:hypothetical protein PLICRDRAFT_177306 [Plicaturopsis crispa FD-325 SS-3]
MEMTTSLPFPDSCVNEKRVGPARSSNKIEKRTAEEAPNYHGASGGATRTKILRKDEGDENCAGPTRTENDDTETPSADERSGTTTTTRDSKAAENKVSIGKGKQEEKIRGCDDCLKGKSVTGTIASTNQDNKHQYLPRRRQRRRRPSDNQRRERREREEGGGGGSEEKTNRRVELKIAKVGSEVRPGGAKSGGLKLLSSCLHRRS